MPIARSRLMLASSVAASLVILASIAPARAQVFYAPVEVQHGGDMSRHGRTQFFYYGGSDPHMIDFARDESLREYYNLGGSGHELVGGNVYHSHNVVNPKPRIYSDLFPYRDASSFGYTVNDAINDANMSVPRYFRKRDIDAAAIPVSDGWVVPAHAHPHMDMVRPPLMGEPTTRPGMILIVPKSLLKPEAKPVQQVSHPLVASSEK